MTTRAVRLHLRNGEPSLARAAARAELETATGVERAELAALLARALVRCGEPAEALRRAREAVAGWQGWEAWVALGEAQLATGNLGEAEEAVRSAWDLLAAVDVDGAPPAPAAERVAVAAARSEIARSGGRIEQAMMLARGALREAERGGLEGPERAEALAALGGAALAAEDLETARSALERCLELRSPAAGSCDVAATLDALGQLERREGRGARAVELHRAALERWIAQLGPRALPVAACRHSLAQALHRTGDFVGAHAEMELATDLTARFLGEEHPDTWIGRFELGRMEMDIGRTFEGLDRMERAFREAERRLGADHPVIRSMKRWL